MGQFQSTFFERNFWYVGCNNSWHRFLMKMEESPTCEKCQLEEETAEHFITECPAYMEERYKVFGSRLLNKSELAAIRVRDLQRFKNETGRFDNPEPEV